MSKFRKKPVVIEAVRAKDAMACASQRWVDLPEWISDAYDRAEIVFLPEGISIQTLEGIMLANPEDWVIRGVNGEIYPCKPDIFAKSYEPVEDVAD